MSERQKMRQTVPAMAMMMTMMIVLVSLQVWDSYACSCSAHPPDFLATWAESDGAFQATVNDILTSDGPRKVVFDIHQVQRGWGYPYGNYTLEDSSIIHYYGKGMITDSSCSVDYRIGETYQVFVHGDDQSMSSTNMCSTKRISGSDEYSHEDEYGQIQHYRQDYDFFGQYSLFSLAVPAAVLAMIAGVVVWRKRRFD